MKDKIRSKRALVSIASIMIAFVICMGFSLANSEAVFAADGGVIVEEQTETEEENAISNESEENEVRYPNKLTPKSVVANSESSTSVATNSSDNEGVASEPSNATATVTENKNNANEDYPIHNGEDETNNQYSADERQFITFETKNGKVFYLIINHDEETENVQLLTEVSEDDLLNMVEKKEPAKQEVVKEETTEEEAKPVKQEDSDFGTYLIIALVVIGALGASYYFKVVKKKEAEEVKALEEEDDDDSFFAEENENENAEEYQETEETDDLNRKE